MPPLLDSLDRACDLLRRCAPSVLTLGALMSGLSAVRFAQEGLFSVSVKCVMLAAVLDGLDGHVARYLGVVSEMGAELDSLCDLANFGVTPALVAYFWGSQLPRDSCLAEDCFVEHTLLWMACCLYSSCCALRLARFNIAGRAEEMDKQHLVSKSPSGRLVAVPVRRAWFHNVLQRKLYFQGIPAPVGAAYALAPMMLSFSSLVRRRHGGPNGVPAMGRRGIAAVMFAVGALMVSSLPTLSSKMLKTDRDDTVLRSRTALSSLVKVASGLSLCGGACLYPFDLFLLLVLGHLISIPVGTVIYYRCARPDKPD